MINSTFSLKTKTKKSGAPKVLRKDTLEKELETRNFNEDTVLGALGIGFGA